MTIAGLIAAISAALPVLSKVLDLFIKTPVEKLEERQREVLSFIRDIHEGVKKSIETGGDTSSLEDTINKRVNK